MALITSQALVRIWAGALEARIMTTITGLGRRFTIEAAGASIEAARAIVH